MGQHQLTSVGNAVPGVPSAAGGSSVRGSENLPIEVKFSVGTPRTAFPTPEHLHSEVQKSLTFRSGFLRCLEADAGEGLDGQPDAECTHEGCELGGGAGGQAVLDGGEDLRKPSGLYEVLLTPL